MKNFNSFARVLDLPFHILVSWEMISNQQCFESELFNIIISIGQVGVERLVKSIEIK